LSGPRSSNAGKAVVGCLQSYRDLQNIFDWMAAADSSDTRGQRDLAMSYGRLARAFREAHENGKARDALRQGRAIIARLTQLSPDNAVWKRDLAGFDGQLAELDFPPAGQNAIPSEMRESTGGVQTSAAINSHGAVDEHTPTSAPTPKNRPVVGQPHQLHTKLRASAASGPQKARWHNGARTAGFLKQNCAATRPKSFFDSIDPIPTPIRLSALRLHL
jgi:hypothetical protein